MRSRSLLIPILSSILIFAGCETIPAQVTLQPVETTAHLPLPNAAQIDSPPELVTQARPQYPRELRAAGVQGKVRVEMIVGADGAVTDAIAITATDIRFANAAIACVRQWKFHPAMANGKPVASRIQVPIEFALDSQL